jgi:hypothetical protein
MIEQYRTFVIWILRIILLIISFLLIDFILPKEAIDDQIISYQKTMVSNNSQFSKSKVLIGYKYFTQKGFHFSTEKKMIKENEVTLFQTRILKNIVGLRTAEKDYSEKLISGLNGVTFYLILILALSSIISLLLLFYYKKLSENGFQNIILFNSLIVFYIVYFVITH